MAQQQRQLSPRDRIYLESTGFEVYMGAGGVFLLVFTVIFIYSIKAHFEWLVWPGLFLGVVAGYITLKVLERRELKRKLAEIEAEQQEEVTRR